MVSTAGPRFEPTTSWTWIFTLTILPIILMNFGKGQYLKILSIFKTFSAFWGSQLRLNCEFYLGLFWPRQNFYNLLFFSTFKERLTGRNWPTLGAVFRRPCCWSRWWRPGRRCWRSGSWSSRRWWWSVTSSIGCRWACRRSGRGSTRRNTARSTKPWNEH